MRRAFVALVCLVVLIGAVGPAGGFLLEFNSGQGPIEHIWTVNENSAGEVLDATTGTKDRDAPYQGTYVIPTSDEGTDLVWNHSDDTITAFSGATGEELWNASAPDETQGRDMWQRTDEHLVVWVVAGDGTFGNLTVYNISDGSRWYSSSITSNSNSRQLAVSTNYIYTITSTSFEQRYIENGTTRNAAAGSRGVGADKDEQYVVAVYAPDSSTRNITVRDPDTWSTIATAEPDGNTFHNQRIAFNGDGEEFYISQGGGMKAFETATLTEQWSIPTTGSGNNPEEIFADGERIYGWDQGADEIRVYDPADGSLTANYSIATDREPAPALSYDLSTVTQTLVLDFKAFMEHDSEQPYEIFLEETNTTTDETTTTDVTEQASVSSGDTGVITVDESAHELIATSDESVSATVTITATYQDVSGTRDVFVGNKTLDNIGDLPPPTWMSAVFGSPGGTTGATGTWPGAVQLQWLFVCLVVGAIVSWKSGHAMIGVGVAEVMLAFGWAIAWVSDGVLIASIIFVVYAALAVGDVASGGMAKS